MLKRVLSRIRPAPRAQLPPQVVMLMTNPRSGSTWIFDALRCHPAIHVQPQADVFAYFGMTGRRYPRDLSRPAPDSVQVEVRRGTWEPLPVFTPPPGIADLIAPDLTPYALEKTHPHFARWDAARFADLARRYPGTLKVIYQVRDPQESVLSFLRYQQRNPDWNARKSPDRVIPRMRRIYESLAQMTQLYPGMAQDYAAINDDFTQALTAIFDYLWGEPARAHHPELFDFIAQATRRDQRAATPFLGERTTDVTRDAGEYADLLARYRDDLDACYRAYHAVLGTPTH